LGEWDVNRESEFYPHIEKDVISVLIHPEYYPGNLYNDIAIVKFEGSVDFGYKYVTPPNPLLLNNCFNLILLCTLVHTLLRPAFPQDTRTLPAPAVGLPVGVRTHSALVENIRTF
jgi:hypothetical protein